MSITCTCNTSMYLFDSSTSRIQIHCIWTHHPCTFYFFWLLDHPSHPGFTPVCGGWFKSSNNYDLSGQMFKPLWLSVNFKHFLSYDLSFKTFFLFFWCAFSWTAVSTWRWIANDDNCGICRMAFDSCCPDCKMPGDDCPLGETTLLQN